MREEWVKQGITVYFFVHCPIEEHSPSTARYFQELLVKAVLKFLLYPGMKLKN